MARLRTVGWEAAAASATDAGSIEGLFQGTGAAIDTGTVRTGTRSCKVNSGASNDLSQCNLTLTAAEQALGRGYYLRVYLNMPGAPTSECPILGLFGTGGFVVTMTTAGALKLQSVDDSQVRTNIGSASGALTAGQWYRVELFANTGSGATDAAELRLDGNTVASGSSLSVTDTTIATCVIGFVLVTPGANTVLYFDDLALNDDQGSSQNSWPGAGRVILLKPTADSQVGSWTGGSGGTSNLWQAVSNIPPAGTASETNTTQIESADSSGDNSTDEYRATLTDYATAGLTSADTITVVQAVIEHGEDVATQSKTGSVALFSNPAQGSADTFTFGNDVGALGTWPSNWRTRWGTAQASPSVTLGTSPVIALRKTDGTTRVASVDFVGLMVEYIAATAPFPPAGPLGPDGYHRPIRARDRIDF